MHNHKSPFTKTHSLAAVEPSSRLLSRGVRVPD